jgi:hypothetical protein
VTQPQRSEQLSRRPLLLLVALQGALALAPLPSGETDAQGRGEAAQEYDSIGEDVQQPVLASIGSPVGPCSRIYRQPSRVDRANTLSGTMNQRSSG